MKLPVHGSSLLIMSINIKVTKAVYWILGQIPEVSFQVEIPGGRGKPSTFVEKDDGIDKVLFLTQF